jgi:hypothetical protein
MRQRISVILNDEALGRIQQIAGELSDAGMHVERQLPITGFIGGTATTEIIPALRAVDGVLSVELEATAEPSSLNGAEREI